MHCRKASTCVAVCASAVCCTSSNTVDSKYAPGACTVVATATLRGDSTVAPSRLRIAPLTRLNTDASSLCPAISQGCSCCCRRHRDVLLSCYVLLPILLMGYQSIDLATQVVARLASRGLLRSQCLEQRAVHFRNYGLSWGVLSPLKITRVPVSETSRPKLNRRDQQRDNYCCFLTFFTGCRKLIKSPTYFLKQTKAYNNALKQTFSEFRRFRESQMSISATSQQSVLQKNVCGCLK
jgi:hypothetical protein